MPGYAEYLQLIFDNLSNNNIMINELILASISQYIKRKHWGKPQKPSAPFEASAIAKIIFAFLKY